MEITVKRGPAHEQKTACLVIGVHAGKKLTPAAEAIDRATKGLVSRLVKRGDVSGGVGEMLLVPEAAGSGAERVLLVGVGKGEGVSPAEFDQIVQKAAGAVTGASLKNAVSCLAEVHVRDRDLGWKVRRTAQAFGSAAYRFDRLKSKPSRRARLGRLTLLVGADEVSEAQAAANVARGLLAGMALMKDLANLPGNHCPPAHLAATARELAREHRSLKVQVLEKAEMQKLGMGALLAVARGSAQAPKLVTLEYHGRGDKSKPIVIVGKGVTFDSGGISIKPAAAMDEMKFDMTGAASVLGVMKAVAELALPINVVGVVPAVENMPDGEAVKPGDVVTSLSGQTIEILNTDAEGRLILCDALTYAARFEPEVVIDVATLTGACVIALGSHATGLLANDDELAGELLAAGEKSGDRAWRLPLWEDYQKQLDSPFADMSNVGGREAGTITAACFLARFTRDYRWAHMDIAGTAWTGGKAKGSTGRPLPLLLEFILGRAART